jgi:histone deacetylase 1/2
MTVYLAIFVFTDVSIDFSFSGTKSKDTTRGEHYIGLNKETSYILIVDHFTRRYHGDTRVSKATPLNWIRDFLEDYSPDCPDKYVYMDQGGELYRNPEVRKLFKQFKYEIRPTGADSSNQNGPVERAHLNVGNAIRAMLHGANLPIKFWPYAFHHYIRLKNAIPSKDQNMSPIELSVGQRENFAKMKTFGCRVWVRPTTR